MTGRTPARPLAGLCLLAAAAAHAVLIGPAAASAQVPPTSSLVLGGFHPAGTDEPRIQEAGAVLAAHVGGELASVDAAQSSTAPAVRLEITLADGARWSGQLGYLLAERRFVVRGEPLQLAPPPGEGEEEDTGSNDGSDSDE
jgi:hypothetical protein